MNAVDTNVLVYFVDNDDPRKRAGAIELLDRLAADGEETVLLWQVAAEFLSCMRRWEHEGRIGRKEVVGNLSRVRSMLRCTLPSENILQRSLDLSVQHSLSHWDSMLLAACIDANVHTLYSEDLSNGTTYDSVTVVNPFA